MEILCFLVILYFAIGLFFMVLGWFSVLDRSKWRNDASPDPYAAIIHIATQKVKYSKNNAKMKTTVVFSDGFYFITHKTDREEHFMSYSISVDAKLQKVIIANAISAHNKAILKKTGIRLPPDYVPEIKLVSSVKPGT